MDANVGISPAGLQFYADRRLGGLAGKLGAEVQDEMFAGTDATNRMLGLLNFVKDAAAGGQTAALGFTTAELAAMNTQASLQLTSTATQDSFVELLLKELAKVPGANAILMNVNLYARMQTIARRLHSLTVSVDQFGVPVTMFNNIPMVEMPVSALPQTESDGTNTDNCSLFIARFAEELGAAFSTNSGFLFTDFENYQVNPSGMSRLQFFLNLNVERTDALRRLSRIRL